MMRFKKILVAYDGSENSIRALEAAKTIATDQQSHITVAYVNDPTDESTVFVDGEPHARAEPDVIQSQPVFAEYGLSPNNEYDSHLNENMVANNDYPERVISDAETRLASLTDVDYQVLRGNVVPELKRYAEDTEADLIVIGNRGLSGIKKFFMGSVSKRLSNEAECSVFVVK